LTECKHFPIHPDIVEGKTVLSVQTETASPSLEFQSYWGFWG